MLTLLLILGFQEPKITPCPLDHCYFSDGDFIYGRSDDTPEKYFEGDVSKSWMTHCANLIPIEKC